jgi:hypothetical protein
VSEWKLRVKNKWIPWDESYVISHKFNSMIESFCWNLGYLGGRIEKIIRNKNIIDE